MPTYFGGARQNRTTRPACALRTLSPSQKLCLPTHQPTSLPLLLATETVSRKVESECLTLLQLEDRVCLSAKAHRTLVLLVVQVVVLLSLL